MKEQDKIGWVNLLGDSISLKLGKAQTTHLKETNPKTQTRTHQNIISDPTWDPQGWYQ